MAGRGNFRRPFGVAGSRKSRKDWYGLSTFNGVVVAGTPMCSWAILPSVIDTELVDPTVIMCRIAYLISNATQPANNSSVFALGLIRWNFIDDTIPTQCPRPLTDVDADWLYWAASPYTSQVPAGSLGSNGSGPESLVRTKAKRKLGNDSSLLWSVEVGAGSVSVNFHMHGRALLIG